MTAPATYQTGGQMPRRPRAPGSMSSPMGDGSPQANGLQQMPSSSGAPAPRQWQTSHPPAPQGSTQPSAPPPTFAQMQANGQARPAPPSAAPPPQGAQPTMQTMQAPAQPPGASSYSGAGGVGSTLSGAVQQALQNPSTYGASQVQDVYKMLTQNLGQDYDYQRQQLGEEMARRGLSDSTIAGQHYSDLATEQARAQANIATQLAQQAALTYGQDRNSAIQAGLGLGNLDLAQQLGLGNLGVAQQNANTQQAGTLGNLGLGQQQLNQQGSQFQQTMGENARQFNQQQALAQMLGLGNLGVAQQQAATGAQSVANQYALGQGQLGISQQAQDLARQLGLGNLGIQQQQLNQQGSQFQQQLALDQLKNQQQFGLQQADLTGNYNGQSTLASRAQQMAQQQFAQQLAQQLGIATMQDKTANRGIDVQGVNNNNQLMMQLAMLGITGGLANSVAGIASGATGGTGGSTASTGGTGGAASSSLSPGAQSFLNDPANQQKDPRLYATLALSNNDPNLQAYLNDPTKSINFGGQQYTGREYLQLMQQHPELFGVNTAANQNAAYNADWFKNSVMQSATPLPSDLVAQMNGQPDPNALFTPSGNDYGFAQSGGRTLNDWNAYQGSEQYKALKWASEHPGQPYPNAKPVTAPTKPEDTDAYETQRLLDLAAQLGLSPADVGLTNYDY